MIYVLKVKDRCTGTTHHSLICILDIDSHIRDELIVTLGRRNRLGLNSSLLVNYLRCDNHPILENERSAKRLPLSEKLSHGRKLQVVAVHELVVGLGLRTVIFGEVFGPHKIV